MSDEPTTDVVRLTKDERAALVADLRHLFGAHADVAANHIAATVERIIADRIAADCCPVQHDDERMWVCPTCGPHATEPHPRHSRVQRCSNCKEWASYPPGSRADDARG